MSAFRTPAAAPSSAGGTAAPNAATARSIRKMRWSTSRRMVDRVCSALTSERRRPAWLSLGGSCGELAAGGLDIASSCQANRRDKATTEELVAEGRDRLTI